jgi:hypothetical protein
MLKSMKDRDVYLKEGELVLIEDISDKTASIISSNSAKIKVPTNLLITRQDFNNMIANKINLSMDNSTDSKSNILLF